MPTHPIPSAWTATTTASPAIVPSRTGASATASDPAPSTGRRSPSPAPAPAPAAGVTFVSVRVAAPAGRQRHGPDRAGRVLHDPHTTPAGTVSEAAGLVPKTADGSGRVSWTWNIGSSTRPGTGRVTVTCNGVSATADIQIG
jgi:micrococcal nuclease